MTLFKLFKDHLSMKIFVVFQFVVIYSFISMFNVSSIIAFGATLLITMILLRRYYKQQNIKEFYGNVVDIESSEQKEHFKEKGLTSDDMEYFKEVMDEANNQIYSIKSQIVGVTPLEKAMSVNDTVEIIEELYKDIVNEPERLHDVNKFLYIHLPTLEQLVSQYVQINNHRRISEQGKRTLDETINTIKEVNELIDQDYLDFRNVDVETLRNNIQMTKKRLEIEENRKGM